jgi:hypothetical protein
VLSEGLGKLKEKSNDLTGIRTRDHPPCSIVSQPSVLPRADKQYFVVRQKNNDQSPLKHPKLQELSVQQIRQFTHPSLTFASAKFREKKCSSAPTHQ